MDVIGSGSFDFFGSVSLSRNEMAICCIESFWGNNFDSHGA